MYGEFQCIMGNGHMGPPLNKMTHTIENITFPQLRWRAVKMLTFPQLRWRTVKNAML